MIRTITHDVEELPGFTLGHEHLQINLDETKGPHVVIGSADLENVIDDIKDLQRYGFGAIVDVTASEVGRDPEAFIRINRETGISIICSTGFYWDPYHQDVIESKTETLAQTMVSELTNGINGSQVRCGVIKVGTSPKEIGSTESKVFEAAAIAHHATGAPIITHTSDPKQALWQVDALLSHGVDLSHVLIGHLDYANEALLKQIWEKGAYIGIDQISFTWKRADLDRARLVKLGCDAGFSHRIILSSDVARQARLIKYGGTSYSTVSTVFVPLLRDLEISQEHIERILRDNPNQLLRWKS